MLYDLESQKLTNIRKDSKLGGDTFLSNFAPDFNNGLIMENRNRWTSGRPKHCVNSVRIGSYSGTPYFSVFSPNAGKCGPE